MNIEDWLRHSGLPRLEARMLLEQVSGWTRARMMSEQALVLDAAAQERLDQLRARRLQGEPMAYILGEREFYGLMFQVDARVLIPRPETEHLLEAALDRIPERQPCRVLDLGTGSGCLAITLAKMRPQAEVLAVDRSRAALAVAQANARRHQVQVHWVLSDWLQALRPGQMDVIVSNPPYIAAEDEHLQQGDVRFEPLSALTDFGVGTGALTTLIEHGLHHLRPGGFLLLEHGYDQSTFCQNSMRRLGYQQVQSLHDLAGHPRVTLGQWPHD